MSSPETSGPQPAIRRATAADRAAIERLVTGSGLLADGIPEWIDHFWVADALGAVVAVAGLELYEDGALLRSVAVAEDRRGTGVGRTLVERALGAAGTSSDAVFLLTTTAAPWFRRLGFDTVARSDVPESVRRSSQFRGACPDSATVMRRRLDAAPTTPPR
jgi:amino-acid N-acetyltransferase